jgi:hypothetical protein
MCRYSVPQRMSFRRRTERRRLRSFLRSFPSVAFTKTGDPIIRPVNARSRSKRSSSRRARMVSKSSAARGRATIPPLFIGSLEFAQIRSRFRRLYPRNGLFGIAPFDVLLCDPFRFYWPAHADFALGWNARLKPSKRASTGLARRFSFGIKSCTTLGSSPVLPLRERSL